ncbi:MAG: diacylglycerol kinase family protein [Planctomycetaceae bacterium]|nr:diacylglycerol kinase family protein [Planctomycetaceae bacterium]
MKQPSLWRSFGHAFDGIWLTVRTQRNARIHGFFAICVIVVGVWLRLDALRWSILTVMIGAVLVGETINTAVEALVDLLAPQFHERAKVAKDVSAGAVLLLGITAVVVGLLILGPPLWEKVFGH